MFKSLLTVCGIFFAISLFGARIEGYVTDAQTGETLPGATVRIKGTTKGTTTSMEGYYVLNNVPNGMVTIVAEFIGYHDLEVTLDITSRVTYKQDFILVRNTTDLNEIVISERATGQVKTLKDQKEAENIMNIVAEEQIISFPDLNAADAIQRVPGITLQRDQGEGRYVQIRGTPPELSNFNVNGIQLPSPESSIRTVGMDVINASQIQTLEIAKVLTPDINGDAIGGSVNIKTKRAESPEPIFNVVLAGGYNNLRQTPNSELQFTFSQRKGRFGFLMNANRVHSKQGADNMEFDYEKGAFFGGSGQDNFNIHYSEVQLRHYDITRERIGLTGTLDFYIDENNVLFLNGMYNRFSDDEVRRRKVYTLDDPVTERRYLFGGIEHDVRARDKIQTISTVSLGGEHKNRLVNISYELAWSQASELEPDWMEAVFENPGQAIDIKFDVSDPDFPVATFPGDQNFENATDYENYDLDKLIFEDATSIDENIIGRVDFEIPYASSKSKNRGAFKFGTLLRFKDKSRDIRAQSYGAYREQSNLYPISGPPLNVTTVDDGFVDDNFLDRGYLLDNMPAPDLMRDFFELWPTLFIFGDEGITETRERTFAQDYTAEEDVQAYYAMVRHHFDDLMVLAGVRYERTDISYEGFAISKRSSGFIESTDTLRDNNTVEFWLPNLQLKYSLSPNTNLRAAATYSYARPNFRDVIPYRVQQERRDIRLGNAFLEYPYAFNLDVLYEHYWKGRNMLSGGVFYKNIDDFVFNYKVFGFEGDPTEANLQKFEIELPVNGRRALVTGAEFQVMSFFDRLPGKLKNLGAIANYTYTYSEGQIAKRFQANDAENLIIVTPGQDFSQLFNQEEEETIPLPGQSPHALNLALFYDSPKWYFKVSANFNDTYLHTLGADEDLDEYYASQWRVDLNGYYQVNQVLQIFGDIRNVTNAPLRYYLGPPENRRILLTEFYSYWARIGARLQF